MVVCLPPRSAGGISSDIQVLVSVIISTASDVERKGPELELCNFEHIYMFMRLCDVFFFCCDS